MLVIRCSLLFAPAQYLPNVIVDAVGCEVMIIYIYISCKYIYITAQGKYTTLE